MKLSYECETLHTNYEYINMIPLYWCCVINKSRIKTLLKYHAPLFFREVMVYDMSNIHFISKN